MTNGVAQSKAVAVQLLQFSCIHVVLPPPNTAFVAFRMQVRIQCHLACINTLDVISLTTAPARVSVCVCGGSVRTVPVSPEGSCQHRWNVLGRLPLLPGK